MKIKKYENIMYLFMLNFEIVYSDGWLNFFKILECKVYLKIN